MVLVSSRIFNPEDYSHLDAHVVGVIQKFLHGEGCFDILLWMELHEVMDSGHRRQIAPFQHAVNSHRRPPWQYKNERDKDVCDINLTPRIQDIGNQMYCDFLSDTVGSYHAFPKRLTREKPGEFCITIVMHVVRDVQYTQDVIRAYPLNRGRVFSGGYQGSNSSGPHSNFEGSKTLTRRLSG